MEVIYGLIPGMLILGLVAVAVLFWAARTGQFEDLDGDGRRILMDEDLPDPRCVPDAEPDSAEPAENPGAGGSSGQASGAGLQSESS